MPIFNVMKKNITVNYHGNDFVITSWLIVELLYFLIFYTCIPNNLNGFRDLVGMINYTS